jgi:hypothetical protein
LPNVVVSRLRLLHVGGAKILRASTYGRGVWQVFVGTTSVGFGRSSLAFPLTIMSGRSTVRVLFLNPGDTPLTLQPATTSGSFTISKSCSVVPARGFCDLEAVFSPQQTGTHESLLVVPSNGADSPHSILLQGTAVEFELALARPQRPGRSAPFTVTAGHALDLPLMLTTGTTVPLPVEVECSTNVPTLTCSPAYSSLVAHASAELNVRVVAAPARARRLGRTTRAFPAKVSVRISSAGGEVVRTFNFAVSVQ